jgi:hypothetical protein
MAHLYFALSSLSTRKMNRSPKFDPDRRRAFVTTRFTVGLADTVHVIRVGKPLPAPLQEQLAQPGEEETR